MKLALFLLSAASLAAVVSAQIKCEFPQTWEAFIAEHNEARGRSRYSLFNYDGPGERISIEDRPPLESKVVLPGYKDIYLYRENTQYHENMETKKCVKMALNETWRPIEIPFDAKFLAPLYIGAEEYGYGLRVDLWGYNIPGARHILSVTHAYRSGAIPLCIPVSDTQAVVVPGNPTITRTFYNVREGDNPDHFVPPPDCQ